MIALPIADGHLPIGVDHNEAIWLPNTIAVAHYRVPEVLLSVFQIGNWQSAISNA